MLCVFVGTVQNHRWFKVSVFTVGRVSYHYYNLHKPAGTVLSAGMFSEVTTCKANCVWLVRRMSLCQRPLGVNWAIRETNYLTSLPPCTGVIQRHVKLSGPTETKRSGDEKRSSPVRPIKTWRQPCVTVSDPAACRVKKSDAF